MVRLCNVVFLFILKSPDSERAVWFYGSLSLFLTAGLWFFLYTASKLAFLKCSALTSSVPSANLGLF